MILIKLTSQLADPECRGASGILQSLTTLLEMCAHVLPTSCTPNHEWIFSWSSRASSKLLENLHGQLEDGMMPFTLEVMATMAQSAI